ncbi:DUF1836 domain-containing protein [Clostridiaceae bacterium M8S5]|nr:DUF1836 domain-containing protein [Clostridiaceae bacterium M8S5]
MNESGNILSYEAVTADSIPTIDLYMDQLTSYLDSVFEKYKVSTDEKILTKTMINNYVKAKLIEKPTKKKYSKEQIMQLIMIYSLKNVMSINEVSDIFKLNSDNCEFEKSICIKEMYNMFIDIQEKVLNESKSEEEQNESINKVETILRLIIKADINKRLAQKMLLDINIADKEK